MYFKRGVNSMSIKTFLSRYTDGKRFTYLLVNLTYNLGQVFALGWTASFLTDILDYNAFHVATALLIGRVLDVVASTLTGPLLQHFNPSRGKRDQLLSWAHLLQIAFMVSLILLFSNTTCFGTAGVWVSGFYYALFSGTADMLQGTFYSMMGVMAGSDQDMRNNLSIASIRGGKFAMLLLSTCSLPMITFFGQYFSIWNYTIVAAVYGFTIIIGMNLFSHYYVKNPKCNVKPDEQEDEGNFLDTCKALLKNRYLRAILLCDIFYYSGMYIPTNLNIYYFKLMGEFGSTYTRINTIIDIAALVGIFVLPALGIRLGKKRSKTIWLLVYGSLMILMVFIGDRSVWILGIIKIITQSLMMLWNFYLVPYLLDAAEAYLYETGIDTRIAAPATIQIANDVGTILGGSIASYGLAFIGYDSVDLNNLAAIPAGFMQKFLLLFGIAGILVLIAAFIWIRYYQISDEQADFYAKENEKRVAKFTSKQ